MPENPTKEKLTPPFDFRGKIYNLLLEGHSPSKAARLVGCSVKTACKWANYYADNKQLEQVIGKPKLFQKRAKKIKNLPPHYATATNGVSFPIPAPLLRPHKVSAILAVVGKPNVKRKKAWATIKDFEYTLQIGVDKAILTLNLTQGASPDDNLQYARARIPELCDFFAKKYECKFAVLRYLKGVEWCLTDKPASKTMSEEVPIRKTERLEVADARFWFDSVSHPKEIQITPMPAKPQEMPTVHAQTLYFLLTAAPALMEKQINLTTSITESIVVLNQKIETLAELIRKAKP